MKTEPQTIENLQYLVAVAVVETYLDQDREADQDPDCRQHLLRDLNQNLRAWGVSYLARPKDLDRLVNLEAILKDCPAVELLVRNLPNRVSQWAKAEPKGNDLEHVAWSEKAVFLLSRYRVESQE